MISIPRAAVLLAGALALSSTAQAQDPVGIWTTRLQLQGDVREATLTISRGAAGALAGTWSSELGEAELSNVTFAEGVLSFVRKLSFNANEFEMSFEGTIEGNNLTGAFRTQFGELALTGTRAGGEPAAAGAEVLVGTWNGTSSIVGGELSWKLVVGEDLSAVVETGEGTMAVRDLALQGDRLSYVVVVEAAGQKYELAFAGTVEGTDFTGRYSLASLGEIAEVSAAKAAGADLTVMVGTWELKAQSDMGEQTSTMVINEDLSGTVNFGEFGSFPLDYVDIVEGDQLWWGIAARFQDQQVYIEFAGTLADGKFSGGMWVGDQEVAQISGTKKK